MAKENEPAKLLHEPLVAYYCRLYAMERGLKIPQSERRKTTNSLLVSLMKQLEKDKKALTLGPDDNLHLEGFALSVFSKADKQDRAGRADLNTAKTFYAASIFFEILNQFGELQPDLEQKQKYSAWKAADIRKALKEGRKPIPGPPGGDKDLTGLSTAPSDAYDFEPSRSNPSVRPASESDSSPQPYDDNAQHSASRSLPPANIDPHLSSPASYPTKDYSSHNGSQSHNFQTSSHSQAYHHQSYVQEPRTHLPQLYPQDIPSYSYPNFQSYPSFTESSLPTVPSHYPSQNQVSDVSYATLPASTAASQYNSCNRNKAASEAAPTSTNTYRYDSNYQPPPEKISEAHKAARFAVGALAFDDVSVAVDYLKKSLELLTNPSAE